MKIAWYKPNLDKEQPEIEKIAKQLGVPTEDLRLSLERGKIIPLTDRIWSQLNNTDSLGSMDLSRVRALAKDEYKWLFDAMTSGKPVPAPIISTKPSGEPYLVSGNKRLMLSKAFGDHPQIFYAPLVRVDESKIRKYIKLVLENRSGMYIAIKLDKKSKQALLGTFPPKHENVFADHVTLFFNPSIDDQKAFEIGKEVTFSVVGEAFDENGQAVEVILPDGIKSKNKHPHITISTSLKTKPFYCPIVCWSKRVSNNSLVLSGKISLLG